MQTAVLARDLYLASSRGFTVGFNQLPKAERAAWFALADAINALRARAALAPEAGR